jgi:hypothetical protein
MENNSQADDGVVINPQKSEMVTFSEADRIIVFSEN